MKKGMHLRSQQKSSLVLVAKTRFMAYGAILYYFDSWKCRSMILLSYQNVRLKLVQFRINQRNRAVSFA